MIVMCMLGMSLLFAVYASIRVNRLEERVERLEKSRSEEHTSELQSR